MPEENSPRDFVRIPREDLEGLRRTGGDGLAATQRAASVAGKFAATLRHARTFMTGRPLDTEALETERLSIWRALPVLSSDALSSVAYGPEAGLAILATAGAAALIYNVPLGIGIALLMIIVTTSYRQVVQGYRQGGGSYAVARANLGLVFGLIAAGALLVDYILTVAVSVSSGVDALASAFGAFGPYRLGLALLCVGLLMLANLRGVREAGSIFAGPTYLFVVCMLVLIVVGLVRGLLFNHQSPGRYAPISPTSSLTPLLVLTAFASGASSMTGIEAVSNSVPSFERPEGTNAARTLTVLSALLVVLFLGVVALDVVYGSEPRAGGNPTVLSQIASTVFQGPLRPAYYVIQFATLLVLVLAANTSFNGFPRLSAVLAHDDFLPHAFGHLGNRLVYSTAMVFLAVVAAMLIVAFQANTDSLINLYALGVFTAFTLAQAAMARHWWRERSSGWLRRLAINGCGAVVTAVVDGVIIVTKAPRGAWVVIVVVPALVLFFWSVARSYSSVRAALARMDEVPGLGTVASAVVPVIELDHASHSAIRYASAIFPDVLVVHLAPDEAAVARFEARWSSYQWPGDQPRRETRMCGRWTRVGAFLHVLDELKEEFPGRTATVVLPEWAAAHLIRTVLTRPMVARFKLALFRRSDVVVATSPRSQPEVALDRFPEHVAIVPLLDMGPAGRRALAYAVALATEVIAVHVETREDEPPGKRQPISERLRTWQRRGASGARPGQVQLVVIDSPYRSVVEPLIAYMDSWRRAHETPFCTVVLPELVTDRWWTFGLHNHRAFWLKAALLTRASVAVADVTLHLGQEPAT